MSDEPRRKGPWYHRVLVGVFSFLFGLLIFWLLGFVLHDLGTWPGPDWQAIEREVVDDELLAESEQLDEQTQAIERTISRLQQRQADLRDSADSAERTMNQLLEIQRLALEKDQTVSDAERASLEEAKQLFLTNQRQYQQISEQVADLRQQREELQDQQRELQPRLESQREEAREIFEQRRQRHRLAMAAVQLAVLAVLFVAAVWMVLRWRHSIYVPLVYAFGIAVALRAGMVLREHFPARYFKYVLILVAIAGVGYLLVWLLRRVARPSADWLLRQYRDGYERFLCPICEYPIRRGPLRYRFWTRRSIKKMSAKVGEPADESAETEYVCPSCATRLYEACGNCGHPRPSLLPACPHCGTTKPVDQITREGESESVR